MVHLKPKQNNLKKESLVNTYINAALTYARWHLVQSTALSAVPTKCNISTTGGTNNITALPTTNHDLITASWSRLVTKITLFIHIPPTKLHWNLSTTLRFILPVHKRPNVARHLISSTEVNYHTMPHRSNGTRHRIDICRWNTEQILSHDVTAMTHNV